MERFYAFSVFLLVFCSRIYVADAEDESMWMPDPNLRSAVRTTLNLNADEALTQENILKLTGLNAPKLGITDLTGLEHATYLKSLLISGNQIRNIKPLANLRYLTRLYIGGNRIRNIRPLAHLINLKRLGLLRNQISDINALAGLINLEYLRLAGNPITDTSPLTNLPKLSNIDVKVPSFIPDANLRTAVRAALGIETDMRLTIDSMQDLMTLNAPKLGITSLSGLEYATSLRSLSVGGNRIRDLSPLANLRRLRGLYIGGNRIKNIRPLASLISLQRLGLLRNQISDINALAGLINLEYLRLAGNPITDTCPLVGLTRLRDIDIAISCPPHEKSPPDDSRQPQVKKPKVDPPDDDGRQQDDSGQTQGGQQDDTSQSDDSTPQDDTGQQPQQQPDQNPQQQPQPQNNGGQTQNPPQENDGESQNMQGQLIQQVVSEPPEENDESPQPAQQQQQQQPQPQNNGGQTQNPPQEDDDESQNMQKQLIQPVVSEPPEEKNDPQPSQQQQDPPSLGTQAECEAEGGTWISEDGLTGCFFGESVGPTWAPSLNGQKMFIMDRGTLEQLDPETLQAQLDLWRVESDGSALYIRSIALFESVLSAMRPDRTQLLANYPNPFNPETWIPSHLANPSNVKIIIYDTSGTVVHQLDLGHQSEGYYTNRNRATYWDGTNDFGERVASGIYFYRLETDTISPMRKMVIVK